MHVWSNRLFIKANNSSVCAGQNLSGLMTLIPDLAVHNIIE
uniref:Uncharacterized protein n=1 Tax=Anguilla anguilla TaxID=7936 RepID=A0A0E9Q736_ANGAN